MKMTQLRKAVTWTLQIVLAMIFLTVGMAKISGVQTSVEVFNRIGVGQWLRYLTGSVEVLASVLMLFGPYASIGAGLVAVTMIGAIMAHLWLIGGNVVPALALGIASGVVLYLRREIRRSEEVRVIHPEAPRKSA